MLERRMLDLGCWMWDVGTRMPGGSRQVVIRLLNGGEIRQAREDKPRFGSRTLQPATPLLPSFAKMGDTRGGAGALARGRRPGRPRNGIERRSIA